MASHRALVIAALLALVALVALLYSANPALAQAEEEPTIVADQADDLPSDATSAVQILSAENFDASIATGGKWFVKFFAPWCGHCKALAPEWEKAANKLNSDRLHIAKVDCTVSEDICSRYGIQGFPTLKLIEGDVAIDYNGPRSIAGFEAFVNRMNQPALIEIRSEEDLDSFMKSHSTAFLFFAAEDSPEKQIVESAVKPFRASSEFAHVSPTLSAKVTELGASSLPAFVIRTPDVTFVYDGAWEAALLSSWISSHQFGLLPELEPQIFQDIIKTGKPVVMMALLPQKQNEITKRMQDIGREVARSFFDSFVFTWIDGEKWIQYLEGTYKAKQDELPQIIVLDPKKNGYFTSKAETQETFTSFLDSITSGVLKPTVFSRGEPNEQDLPWFEQYKMLAEDYITQYLWYSLLGVFIGGVVCGKFLLPGGRRQAPTSKPNKKSAPKHPKKE